MKRFILWMIATVICCFTMAAQTVGVAVLTHGNDKTMFYGNTALQQAVEAATDGDVISLSPGTFTGLRDFSKSGLTIIGSGMNEGPSQTTITEFLCKANNNEKFVKLTLKNLHIPRAFYSDNGSYELSFDKCRAGSFKCSIAENESSSIEMSNCISEGDDTFKNTALRAYNSVLHPYQVGGIEHRSTILTNCILLGTPGGINEVHGSCSISNCIIIDGYQYSELNANVRATYCKALVVRDNYFGLQTLTNERLPEDFEPFVEGSFYELKPELASSWVDEHGSQIGIYGGPVPFNPLPDAPRFTKFNVPAKSDADGKLPVEIEIAMPER